MPAAAPPSSSHRSYIGPVRIGPAPSSATGRIVGQLAAGEDRETIVDILRNAPQMVAGGVVRPLLHGDIHSELHSEPQGYDALERRRAEKARAIVQGTAKRYVLLVPTAAGDRIVKIAEPLGLGNRLSGLVTSSARAEHRRHARAEVLGVAAAGTRGFLELRRGLSLQRSCQVQTPISRSARPLEPFLAAQVARFGHAAYEALARALAADHARPFFHADVKAFHAFLEPSSEASSEERPTEYRLSWIDLGRVSFYMTPRKRIINLYQAFRFVLPDDCEAQERFVRAYCAAAEWRATHALRVLARVRNFLRDKLRTHPLPLP